MAMLPGCQKMAMLSKCQSPFLNSYFVFLSNTIQNRGHLLCNNLNKLHGKNPQIFWKRYSSTSYISKNL